MADSIHGDSGSGIYEVGVTTSKQLRTFAETTGEETQANLKGNAYNINTGEITLTDAVQTPVLYFKNNEDQDLLITAIAVGLKNSTGGAATDLATITVTRNPKAGTIVSGATDVDIISNRNYGSSNTLSLSDAFKGATDITMTGGTDHLLIYQTDLGRAFATIDEVIPKGRSIGIKITPLANNTSLTCYVALICHLINGV